MARSMTLPALAGLAIVAVGAGVQLGLGAVAEMERGEERAVEARPFASLSPYRSPGGGLPQSEVAPSAAPMEIGIGDLGGCYGCGRRNDYPSDYPSDYSAEYLGPYPGDSAEDHGVDALYEEPTPEMDTSWLAVTKSDPPPAVDDIERYARYPVAMEEAEEVDAADFDGPAVNHW